MMFLLWHCQRTGQIWRRNILSSACDNRIAENLAKSLPYLSSFLKSSALLNTPENLKQLQWHNIGDRAVANLRESSCSTVLRSSSRYAGVMRSALFAYLSRLRKALHQVAKISNFVLRSYDNATVSISHALPAK